MANQVWQEEGLVAMLYVEERIKWGKSEGKGAKFS